MSRSKRAGMRIGSTWAVSASPRILAVSVRKSPGGRRQLHGPTAEPVPPSSLSSFAPIGRSNCRADRRMGFRPAASL
jgi:hypothetical protein